MSLSLGFLGIGGKPSVPTFKICNLAFFFRFTLFQVTYCVLGFMDKNNDLLYRDLSQCMYSCGHPLTKKLFPEGINYLVFDCSQRSDGKSNINVVFQRLKNLNQFKRLRVLSSYRKFTTEKPVILSFFLF